MCAAAQFLSLIHISDKVAIVSLTFLVIIILMAVFAPILSPYGYETTDLLHTNQPPSAEHWFGTDAGGRDLWTRVWVGARISLIIGLGGAIVPQIIGIFLGGLSGFFGGWVDMLIMRIIDVGVCIPSLVYVTLIMLWLDAGPVAIIIAIAITGWMDSARVVRGRMLQFKNREFVLAASTLGASPIRIIFRHILPNILGQQVVNISSAIPAAIFLEAYLSFIGPVSYTHLDVYKRQTISRAPWRWAISATARRSTSVSVGLENTSE